MNIQLSEFTKLIHALNSKGHSPGTTGNYSFFDRANNIVYISESGIDKEYFEDANWIEIAIDGSKHKSGDQRKTSAETDLHLAIYQKTNACFAIHSHHISFGSYTNSKAEFCQQEIIKALKGQTTHDVKIEIPIYANTQDISKLASELEFKNYGFLIRNHGITVWGESLKEVKRHLEVYEYLFTLERLK